MQLNFGHQRQVNVMFSTLVIRKFFILRPRINGFIKLIIALVLALWGWSNFTTEGKEVVFKFLIFYISTAFAIEGIMRIVFEHRVDEWDMKFLEWMDFEHLHWPQVIAIIGIALGIIILTLLFFWVIPLIYQTF